ncbi:MAG: hypothetical protein IJB71_05415 [Bacilli bacterium]|nr:hypothetical protein [Bacilli bacterium]
MDIKVKIEELVSKIKADKNLMTKFKEDPIKVVEDLIGVDLPNEKIEKIIDGIKAKISIDDAKDGLSKITNLFKKAN